MLQKFGNLDGSQSLNLPDLSKKLSSLYDFKLWTKIQTNMHTLLKFSDPEIKDHHTQICVCVVIYVYVYVSKISHKYRSNFTSLYLTLNLKVSKACQTIK